MLLETKQLTKRFRNPGKGPGGVLAVSQANMTLNPGETVGLFGDSGGRKSTLGLMLAGLLRPTSGEILYRGEPVRMPYRGACRRNVQVLFQHPEVSFNPMLPSSAAWRSRTGFISSPTVRKFSTGTLPALVSGRSGAQRRGEPQVLVILVLDRPPPLPVGPMEYQADEAYGPWTKPL